jgi:hypothetical protein
MRLYPSRLVVNVFDGSSPTVEVQEVLDNSAPRSRVEYPVRTLTQRLVANLDQTRPAGSGLASPSNHQLPA